MTAISAIIDKKNKKTYLASDEMGSNGFTGHNYKTKKLFKNGVVSFAYCGSYRLGQILQHNLSLRNFCVDETIEQYVFDYMDTEIRKVLKERAFLKKSEEVESIEDSVVIFAVKDRIFILQSDLSILEPKTMYAASGSGAFHQQGSIETQLQLGVKDYKGVLKTAIKVAGAIVVSVGGEPQILTHDHE